MTERRVPAPRIVEPLDSAERVGPGFITARIASAKGAFG